MVHRATNQLWWRGAVGYQIYPRSFADADGDGNGDLLGVREHLDHLEWLGIDIVWLCPIFPSPQRDNGYDISNYYDIAPMYGTLADWEALVAEIHARDMRVVMDLVVNHTSDEHPWFVESRDPSSPKRNWYWWHPPVDGGPPNNWESRFSGSAWQFDKTSGEYYLHLYAPEQPDLNWENPEVRRAVYELMRWWQDRGVDGFRMDVINFISKDVALPDVRGVAPGQVGNAECFYACGPRLHEFLQEMRREVSVGRNEVPLLIGEAPAATIDDAVLLTDAARGETDMLFQFEHMDIDQRGRRRWDEIPFELPQLKRSLARWQEGLADVGWNSLYLNNHDQPRVVSRWGDDGEHRRESAKLFATALHLHRGTPFVYQGEEIAMANFPFSDPSQFRDVQTIRRAAEGLRQGEDPEQAWPALTRRSRDNARTPMQWSDAPHAGFTTGEPWIEVNPDASTTNVITQRDDPDSVLTHYRELIALRHTDPLVTDGRFILLAEEHPRLWAFIRTNADGALLVLANVSSYPLAVSKDITDGWETATVALSSHRREGWTGKLQPWESIVLRYEETDQTAWCSMKGREMTKDQKTTEYGPELTRRGLITAAGMGAASTVALLGAASAEASPGVTETASPEIGRARFALVSDTHVNLDSTQSTQWLERVYDAIAARQPDAVLHLGDITDTGLDGEYARAGEIVPETLRGKMHYTLGNHEVRWDTTAKEVAHAHIGGQSYSFEVGGLHVIGFDPTQVLEEPGHYGEAGLAWLREDISAAGQHTPIVLFQHYPVGESFYYFDDQDTLISLLAEHNVRAVFAGHVHKEVVSSFNGFTQATLAAIKNGPTFYLAEVADEVLTFSRVELADDGTETETVVAEVPLTGLRPGAALSPDSVSIVEVSNGSVEATVITRRAKAVRVAPYAQHVYGGTQDPLWTELSQSGNVTWQGRLDVTAVSPGEQRLRLQLERDGARWEQTVRYQVPAIESTPSVVWERKLNGPLRAGSVVVGEGARRYLLAVTHDGDLTAHRPATGETIWEATVGPVFRRPAVGRREIYVPSADHTLTALNTARGRVKWQADLGAPVVSQPLLVSDDLIVVAAGADLVAVDAVRGRERWRVAGHGFFAGRAAHNGKLVFSCATDGFARAYRLEDGKEVWSFRMREGNAHSLTLYSGWNNKLLMVGGLVLVSSVSATWALDPATGEKVWQIDKSFMYAETQVIEDRDALLLTTEFGIMVRADVRTGTLRWERELNARIMEAGVQLHGGSAWAQSVDGQLIQVDLENGEEIGRSQNGLAYCFGPTVLVEDTLVVGDQDGSLRAISLPT